MFVREIKRRSHRFIGPSLAICLVAYFGYHLVEGRRGLFAWQHMELQLARAKEHAEKLSKEQRVLENRVTLLKPESICADLLVEQAKSILGYVPHSELVVLQ